MANKTSSYEYDKLGRIVKIAFADGASVSYSYDSAGNRTAVVEIAAVTPPAGQVPTVVQLPKKQLGDFVNTPMVVMLSTGNLVGWGDNTTSVLANGISTANVSPVQRVLFDQNTVTPPLAATIVDWAFSNANLYVVYSNGWVYSAGYNSYGQLGHGNTTTLPYLKRIEYFVTNSISVEKVWIGASYSATYGGGCAYFRATDKKIYGCGANLSGNLGNAATPTTDVTTPAICAGITYTSNHVIDVVVSNFGGYFSAYMLFNDGALMVAGFNAYGQLGVSNNTNVTGAFVSAKKSGGANFTGAALITALAQTNASANALVVDSSGDVWTTGLNSYGELGHGNLTALNVFTKVTALSNVSAAGIGGGPPCAYAITNTGTLYTWGYNAANNLFKNNTTSPVTTPSTATATPGAVSKIIFPRGEALGTPQLIALTTAGRLAYSGNPNGQSGVNNTSQPGAYYYVPTPASLLNGTENIVDVFVHGYATLQRWFILTDLGNLYASGYNTNAICTGGFSNGNPPLNVQFHRLSFLD